MAAAKFCGLVFTAHPSAEWIARQLTEAYGWQRAPRYVIRDRDLRLWRGLPPAPSSDGHTGSADCATLAMAEWICGEADRFNPAGLP